MEETDKRQLFAVLAATGVMYDKKLPREALELYFSSLKDLSLEDVKAAISKHVNCPDRGQYFPKVADIRYELQGPVDSQVLGAWSKVERAIDRCWPYDSVVFDDPLIHAVIQDMGGWAQIADHDLKEWPFVQRQFEQRYKGYLVNPPRTYPPRLPGTCERVNERGGYAIPEAVLIGDPEKAARVLAGGSQRKELTSSEAKAFVDEVRRRRDAETNDFKQAATVLEEEADETFRRKALDALRRNEPEPAEGAKGT